MKKLLAALLMTVSAGTALALPPAVELDRLMLHAQTALDAQSYSEAADNLAKAQKLGIALPENFALSYATALNGLGKTNEAKAVLDKYLNRYGTKGPSYKAVLALLVQIENQEQGKSNAPIQSAPAAGVAANRGGADQGRSPAIGAGVVNQRVPARPQLPFAVSEDIWRAIEASEAYRNSPRPRTYRVSYQASDQMEYTGSKNSFLAKPAASSKSGNTETTSLGDKCWVQQSRNYLSVTGQSYAADNYICGGFLSLGSTDGNKTTGFIKSLDELKGSLFPMRIGNQMSLRYQTAYVADRRFDSMIASSCQVISQGPASELHPALKGRAWKIHCQNSVTSDYNHKPIESEADDYYLEDLGVRLSVIGQLNFREKKFILPQPGEQTVLVTEGDYSSRTTTTYTRYDWSVDLDNQAQGKSGAPVKLASAPAVEANWGLTAQDLSILIGSDIAKKVHLAERRAEILAAAEAGDKVAQYLVGVSYLLGIGVARDDVQYVVWMTKAADQGLVRAIAALGDARIRGVGTPADMLSGWALLLKAVNADNGIAQYNAAFLTLSGTGTVRYNFLSRPDALRMLERSAEAGVSVSQYSLGHSYLEDNEDHSKDLKRARYWLAKAAAQGLPQAMTDLASIPPGH